MFWKSNALKSVVCLALIFVFFFVPAGAVTVSDFVSLKEAVEKGGTQTIYVNESIDMEYLAIPAGADITLKPDGQNILLSFERFEENKSECFYVRPNSNLTISGNAGYTLTIRGSESSAPLITNNGKLILDSGAILTSHTSASTSAGVKNKGVFIMNGGEISHMTGKSGGAVSVVDGGSFILNNGIITENTAANGAGIYLSDGSVSINGGTFSQNTGYDIEIVGAKTLKTEISISGNADISSIHFLNTLAENIVNVPVIQAYSGFSGEIHSISYSEYVSKTKTIEFQTHNDAQNLQNKFSVADEKYHLTPSGNYLIIEPAPDFKFILDKPTEVIIPQDPIKILVSLDAANGKISSIIVTSTLTDGNGNPVTGTSYDYEVKEGIHFDVKNQEKNVLTLSRGTDITEDIDDFFTLTIKNTALTPGKTYTVTISIESSVSNEYDYTKYPTQILTTSVLVTPLILDETSNTNGEDIFQTPIWSFSQKAAVTYVISPYEASLDRKWPAVSRHSSPSYINVASELTEVKVYKSETPYGSGNTWSPASSTVSKNDDGTIKFTLSENDKDAECFKIVFYGRKLGDVVEGTGDTDSVNLYDVDMILHAAVDVDRYIKPEWRLYADTDSDGEILLGDAINAFNFFKGYKS